VPVESECASWVRCPLCRGEFRLQEAIDFVPPALEVIPEPAVQVAAAKSNAKVSPSSGNIVRPATDQGIPELLINPERENFMPSAASFAAPADSTMPAEATDDFKLSPEQPSVRMPPVGRRPTLSGSTEEPWNSPPAGTNQTARGKPAANTRGSSRRPRKERNPIVELMKMVVGGVVGLGIGYGILLWEFKVDPFNLARYLPAAIVPEALKTIDTSGTSELERGNSEGVERSRPADPFAQPATVPAAAPAKNSLSPPGATRSAAEVAKANAAAIAGNAGQTRVELPSLSDGNNATTEPAVEEDSPRGIAMLSLADFSQALSAAQQTTDKLENGIIAPVRGAAYATWQERVRGFYSSLARLAEAVTFLRKQNDDREIARAAATAFLLNLANDRANLNNLAWLANGWIDASNRESNGIVLAGTVKRVEPIGNQFLTSVKLPGRDVEVPVVSSERPEIAVDDTAVVLGVLVQDPMRNLPHYAGKDEMVIWSGLIIKSTIQLSADQS
jgi:hypothetical protein